jgi:hypothetical protein
MCLNGTPNAQEGAAIQRAIWHDEYPGLKITFDNATETALYNGFISQTSTGPLLPGLISVDLQGQVVGGTQGLAFGGGTPGLIPEPGSASVVSASPRWRAFVASR